MNAQEIQIVRTVIYKKENGRDRESERERGWVRHEKYQRQDRKRDGQKDAHPKYHETDK